MQISKSNNSSYPEIIQVTPSASACLEDSDLDVDSEMKMLMMRQKKKDLSRQDTNNCILAPSSFKLETRDLIEEREFRSDSTAALVDQEKFYHQPRGVLGRYLEPIVKIR